MKKKVKSREFKALGPVLGGSDLAGIIIPSHVWCHQRLTSIRLEGTHVTTGLGWLNLVRHGRGGLLMTSLTLPRNLQSEWLPSREPLTSSNLPHWPLSSSVTIFLSILSPSVALVQRFTKRLTVLILFSPSQATLASP